MDDLDQSYHYRVMARALHEIDAAGPGLSLEALAARMGMSAAHFQRIFSAWVGVSPKRYQQYLALGQAREMLRAQASVLETAAAAGLSGGGRLHDLFLKWEAMTPGDYAKGGAGLEIAFADVATPFGAALAMATAKGLCALGFCEEMGREAVWADLTGRWPGARYREDRVRVAPLVEAALGGAGVLQPIGAPFQIQVWKALLRIPTGQVASYGEIARAIGNPRAVRAVGTAIGRNPIGLLIPCHRAIRQSGALGGYHWGLPVKRSMLAWEAARREAAAG